MTQRSRDIWSRSPPLLRGSTSFGASIIRYAFQDLPVKTYTSGLCMNLKGGGTNYGSC
jgi:hypothetical protein